MFIIYETTHAYEGELPYATKEEALEKFYKKVTNKYVDSLDLVEAKTGEVLLHFERVHGEVEN